MTSVRQGESVTLLAQFYEYAGGPAVDLTGVEIEVSGVLGPTSVGVVHVSTGLYAYEWSVALDRAVGDYVAVWTGLDVDADEISVSEVVAVTSSAGATWASVGDVSAITGATVTAEQLAQAEAVVDVYSNRTPAASAEMSARDLFFMKRATCWQAAWQSRQPAYADRNSTASVAQDGLSVAYAAEWQVSLAPLAARALKNLSWKASRTLRTPRVGALRSSRDFTNEASDESSVWMPL